MSGPSAGLGLAEYEALLRADFAGFAERAFVELNPQTDFLTNWHFRVMAAKLAAVREGKIRRLVVNVPPRHLKSHLASVSFPAWCLGHNPSTQILCVSYAQDLADKLSRDCRRIVTSDWYQRLFSARLAPRHQAVAEFETTQQGSRVATSVGGVLTGRGADLIVIDDPLKPEEALSQAQRRAANEWFDHTLYSRLNDRQKGAIVLIMHRLHEDDLVGHVLAQEDWEIVRFPAIAEEDERHLIDTLAGPRVFTRRQGEALHPERASRSQCSSRSARRSANTISPASTSRPRRRWAAAWSRRPGSGITRPTNCRRNSSASCRAGTPRARPPSSAISASAQPGGIAGKDLYLVDVLRRRMEYPELKRAVREQYERFRPSVVLIRDKASGTQLIQELLPTASIPSPAISRNRTRSCACTRRPR
jgi:hypothetical protein